MASLWATADKDMGDAIDKLRGADHRTIAILGTSLLDRMLRHALTRRFIDSSLVDESFNPNGGFLGTLHSKIQLGYLLNLVGKTERSSMLGLSEIRNRFAHQLSVHSFDDRDTRLIDGFAKLSLHEKYTHWPFSLKKTAAAVPAEFEIDKPHNNEELFLVNLQLAMAVLQATALKPGDQMSIDISRKP